MNAVAFSPDGKLLASADNDGTVRLWNPVTGQPAGAPIRAVTNGGGVNAVAFSPDGKLLATAGDDGHVRLWNPATGQPVGAPLPAVTSPGPALGARGGVQPGRQAAGQRRRRRVRAAVEPGHRAGRRRSPSGCHQPAARERRWRSARTASCWPAPTTDGHVRLWNPATGQAPRAPLPPVNGGVNGVAFSPDGKLLASADNDGTVGLWNPATRQAAGAPLPAETGQGSHINAVAFSPDGKLLATAGGDGTVRLWNPATRQASGVFPGLNRMAFSPDGKLLAVAETDGTVRTWDLATGQAAGAPLPAETSPGSHVNAVAFSPDGKLLATAGDDGTVRRWNPATGQPAGAPLRAVTNGGGVNGVAFSPDGKLLATAGGDGTVRLWNPATGQAAGALLPAEPGGGVQAVAFSPDGKLLAAAYSDGLVRLWNPATRQAAGAPLPAGTGSGGACPAWRSARTASSWPAPTPTAPCGRGQCRFSPIRTRHCVPMSGRRQRQSGRGTPRVNHSPASADDTCRFRPGTGLNPAPGNVEINALHGRPPGPGQRRAPASGQRPRVPVIDGDRPLSAAGVARIVTERAVPAWVECAQHETRSSPPPSP